jgi:undecaprenyl-diphosphatase
MKADISIFYFLNNLAGENFFADWVFIFMAEYLAFFIIIAFVAVWFFWKEQFRKKLVTLAFFFLFAGLAYGAVFFIFHPLWPRPRPFDALPFVNQLVDESGYSFPSKHALLSFFTATFVFLFKRSVGFWFIVAAILVTLGRVLAGVHFPIDVVVGAILGILVGVLAFKALKLQLLSK